VQLVDSREDPVSPFDRRVSFRNSFVFKNGIYRGEGTPESTAYILCFLSSLSCRAQRGIPIFSSVDLYPSTAFDRNAGATLLLVALFVILLDALALFGRQAFDPSVLGHGENFLCRARLEMFSFGQSA
jgi:hypothetical protein